MSSLVCGAAGAAGGDGAPAAGTSPEPSAIEDRGSDAERPANTTDTLVEEAIQRRRQGDDEGALQLLERARALTPDSTRVQVHLASVHQALGNWVVAEALLARVLERHDDAYVERNRALLNGAREAVADHLGELVVVGSPSGATVRLDGRAVGALPLEQALKAPIGTHVLEIEAEGYLPAARRIELHAREHHAESVQLLLRVQPARSEERGSADAGMTGASILTWSLAGAAAAAGTAGAVAWAVSESHAQKWNSDDCLPFGSTRERVCGDEREAARRYEALAVTGGAAAVLLGSGALLSAWLSAHRARDDAAGVELGNCGVGAIGISCHGRF